MGHKAKSFWIACLKSLKEGKYSFQTSYEEEYDMIKGAQKRMIVLKTGNSRYFDEAYFVLRREIEAETEPDTAILAEADRILREQTHHTSQPRKRRVRAWCFFLCGILLGAITAALVCLVLL